MSLKGNGVIGIRREDKNKWERRVPLSPDHVRSLVAAGVRVLIQPSNIRIYPNAAYLEAGAEVIEDLASASTILAVKEVPIHLLVPDRTYLFFSHTIKAQPYNMPLLDALLEKRIRMIDYECITEGGLRGGKRLVAFGRFAGIAGMVDFLRGCGERFLSLGFSTPFLNIAAMYMYPDVAAAKRAVAACGEAIAKYGLPEELCPFTAVFTGDGNVSRGAQEIFALLPVKWVSPFELRNIRKSAKGRDRTHAVYAAVATEAHMVRRRRAPAAPAVSAGAAGGAGAAVGPMAGLLAGAAAARAAADAMAAATAVGELRGAAAADAMWLEPDDVASFDKAGYKADPDAFEPIFHCDIAPHSSIIVNCMYWEPRFPRLLNIKQAQALAAAEALPLLGVCDISCDFQGSIEFLKEFTSIESPFYIYEPKADAVHKDLEAPGILFHAVDHLPSECPRDASDHFGSCLLPFIAALAHSDGSKPFAEQADLPAPLRGAVIAAHGSLTPNFDYITRLREANERAEAGRGQKMRRAESFVTVDLIGHLFDTGIIGQLLDAIEDSATSAHIVDFRVGKDRTTPTELRLQLFSPSPAANTGLPAPSPTTAAAAAADSLARTLGYIRDVAAAKGVEVKVEGEETYIHSAVGIAKSVPRSLAAPAKRILVLGSGYVSAPLVDYLLRRDSNHVTLASMILPEAVALAGGRHRVSPVHLDVGKDTAALERLIGEHDLVVSLVPAPCHPPIARAAIAHGKHVVTASYVSPDMRALHEAAAAAHVTILNEAGLDPGMDHMSAMKLIDDARAAGGVITKFSSVCGGLPAPEAANNPLGYKFSWSPRGALAAARNSARYLDDGKVVDIPGEALLTSAAPLRINPAFSIECLPNRDALPYADKYGIAGPALRTMFRGTLRYRGFASVMAALTALGFFEVAEAATVRGISMRGLTAAFAGLAGAAGEAATDDEIFAAVVRVAGGKAVELVDAHVARLGALSPELAAAAREAAAGCSNAALASDAGRQRELRAAMEWMGCFKADLVAPLRGGSSGDGITTPKTEAAVAAEQAAGTFAAGAAATHVPLDTLVALLTAKPAMSFAGRERDMALMRHEVEVDFPADALGGARRELHTSTLIEYAEGGRTAMARTVGFTAAIGAQLILDGKVAATGVVVPTSRDWYTPMLEALEGEGITFAHTVTRL